MDARLLIQTVATMSTLAEEEVSARIGRWGKITFAEFMQVALYHPAGGYYSRKASGNATVDYYTSPSAHPAFGALLAVQLREMWRFLSRPNRFCVIEMGAGAGLLGEDIMEYAHHLGNDFEDALFYVALDRAPPPSTRKAPRHWTATRGVPLRNVVGCFLSNELLDSYPVHLFEVREGLVNEVYVIAEGGQLATCLGEPSTPLIEDRLAPYLDSLPEGYRGEVNLGIAPWMMQVEQALETGFVVTLDYGYEASELYSRRRSGGTLRTYYQHTPGGSAFVRVGEQDITAHVDFSAVISEGAAVGLNTLHLTTQAQFLLGLGFDSLLRGLRTAPLSQSQRDPNLMGLRELVKPDGLGGFRVLVQEKGTGVADKDEIRPDALSFGDGDLPIPMLQPRHLALMRGRYPHLALALEELWPNGASGEGPDDPVSSMGP